MFNVHEPWQIRATLRRPDPKLYSYFNLNYLKISLHQKFSAFIHIFLIFKRRRNIPENVPRSLTDVQHISLIFISFSGQLHNVKWDQVKWPMRNRKKIKALKIEFGFLVTLFSIKFDWYTTIRRNYNTRQNIWIFGFLIYHIFEYVYAHLITNFSYFSIKIKDFLLNRNSFRNVSNDCLYFIKDICRQQQFS